MAQGVGEQVAVFVVLTQTVGACLIAFVPVFPFAAQVPTKYRKVICLFWAMAS